MADCQVELKDWRGYELYDCRACGIRTVSESTYRERCQAVALSSTQPLTSDSGLLGPSGEELPTSEPQHIGGGVYELPTGERVRGREAAEEAMEPSSHDEAY